MLIHFIYQSRAVTPMTPQELNEIADKAVRKNAEADITGILLYSGGVFMQLLEGQYEDVMATVRRIKGDERHAGFEQVFLGNAEARICPYWNMNVVDLQREASADTDELRSLFIDPETGEKVDQAQRTEVILDVISRFSRDDARGDDLAKAG